MSYPFLVELEQEIFPNLSVKKLWESDYAQFFSIAAHGGPERSWGFSATDIKIRLRAFDELSKWWKKFGLRECPSDRWVATWDEHRFKEAYEEQRMHQPFDMFSFLTAMDRLTGNDLIRFQGAILPEWVLSPSYNYVDEPTKLYRAMRDIWYGPRPKKEYLDFGDAAIRYAWHQHHYFPYQPEPELWIYVAMNGKPSYVKGRLYAYNKYRDVTVLEEKFLKTLVNLNITKRK